MRTRCRVGVPGMITAAVVSALEDTDPCRLQPDRDWIADLQGHGRVPRLVHPDGCFAEIDAVTQGGAEELDLFDPSAESDQVGKQFVFVTDDVQIVWAKHGGAGAGASYRMVEQRKDDAGGSAKQRLLADVFDLAVQQVAVAQVFGDAAVVRLVV